MTVLAQIAPPTAPRVAPLPGPPLWEHALLEQPWYPAGALAVLAIVVVVMLNQRGRVREGAMWAAGLGAAGAAILALGLAVKTEREQMAAASRDLVGATARADTRALGVWLASDARLFSDYGPDGLSVPGEGLDKEGILKLVPTAMGRWPLKEYGVDKVQAQSVGPGVGRTQVRVRVVPEAMPVPHRSWWRVDWRRGTDGWRVTQIMPLDIPYAEPHR